jgi:plasmid stabilization system protein ParE
MARLELTPEVLDDFERVVAHLAAHEVPEASERIAGLLQSLQVLGYSPFAGRPVAGGQRELVIGPKGAGFVALYRYVPTLDTVFILALRAQREAGYRRRR